MRVAFAGPIGRGRRAVPLLVLAAAAFFPAVAGAAVFGPAASATTLAARTASSTTDVKSVLPVLISLTPNVGYAGETLTLVGTGFYSANGEIMATFGSRPAPTRCTSRERYLLTVPSHLSGALAVRLRTESGQSNALTFRYG